MGLHGIPRVNLQCSANNVKLSLTSINFLIALSSFGYSAIAFFMHNSYAYKFYSVCYLYGNNYSNKAVTRAFCIVFSAADIFKFPSIHLMINFAYSLTDDNSKLMRIFYFSDAELAPFVLDIFLRLSKNFSIVKGSFYFFLVKNESIVF